MKVRTIIFIVIGIGLLAIAYWFISPFWRVVHVNESLPTPMENKTSEEDSTMDQNAKQNIGSLPLATGTFTGFDKLHNGSGTANIITIDGKTYVRFESDFTVTNGPDLFVGFGKNGEYIKGSEIGKLKGTVGSQNYELTGEFNQEMYNEVWVWCKAFAVPFAKAVLE